MTNAAIPSGSATPPGPGDLTLRLPAHPSALPEVRARVGAFLDARDVADELFYDALSVCHELAANAVAHGSGEGDEIDVRVGARGDHVSIVVSDAARQKRAPFVLSPDEERERGRGLQVVDQLAEWSERIVGGRREVRAELRA